MSLSGSKAWAAIHRQAYEKTSTRCLDAEHHLHHPQDAYLTVGTSTGDVNAIHDSFQCCMMQPRRDNYFANMQTLYTLVLEGAMHDFTL